MLKLGLLSLLLMPLWAVALPSQNALSQPYAFMGFKNHQPWLTSKNSAFMTAADVDSATLSNLSIKNTGADPITVTGIYLFVLGLGNEDACATPLIESEGAPFGALWSPQVAIAPGETAHIGANYLYNMVMFFLYEAVLDGHGSLGTPGSYEGGDTYCLWLGVTDQTVGTGTLTNTNGAIENGNQLVQVILTPPSNPVNFTNVTCNDTTRTCSTNDTIEPQPFPHQR